MGRFVFLGGRVDLLHGYNISTIQRFSAVVIAEGELEKEVLVPAQWPSDPKAKLGERASLLLAWREAAVVER